MYKYDEFTEEQFKHFNRYGGTFTYVAELPHNTEFRVVNGAWDGKIIHKDGEIYLQTTHDDSLCLNGENQMKIDYKYSLWIRNVKQS